MAEQKLVYDRKKLDESIEKNTPASGNRCKSCSGPIACNFMCFVGGEAKGYTPKCKKCGRSYLFAKNVPMEGIPTLEDQYKSLQTLWEPVDI